MVYHKVTLPFPIFHYMIHHQLAHRKRFPHSTDLHLRSRNGIQQIGVLQVYLIRLLHSLDRKDVRIQKVQQLCTTQVLKISDDRIACQPYRSGQLGNVYFVGHRCRQYAQHGLQTPNVCGIYATKQRHLLLQDKIDHILNTDVIVFTITCKKRIVAFTQIFIKHLHGTAFGINLTTNGRSIL